jgi:TATA-box binding protein (TBP) (component of TFIID and TFIIIB)
MAGKEIETRMSRERMFRTYYAVAYEAIKENALLMEIIDRVRITNIVATINLNVCDINLSAISAEHAFCNYHRGTFAAMGVRISVPKCSALIYPAGVVVCMGTQLIPQTWLAALKYVDILNDPIGIPCDMTGLQTDNFVCSVQTFRLDLAGGIRPEWTNMIVYDARRFPGAIVRCKYMGFPFETNVHMALFESGKVNITGARSLYEALYVFVCFYCQFLIHMRHATRALAAAGAPQPAHTWNIPRILDTDIKPAEVENYHEQLLKHMHRTEGMRAGREAVKLEVNETRGRYTYTAQYADGSSSVIDTSGLEGMPDYARESIIHTALTKADDDGPDYDFTMVPDF